jgi:Arc/MetJ-type ribon-helix-helix transcriptional regulator
MFGDKDGIIKEVYMTKTQFSVRMDLNIKNALDRLVDGINFKNRSHLVQFIITDWLRSQAKIFASHKLDDFAKQMNLSNTKYLMEEILKQWMLEGVEKQLKMELNNGKQSKKNNEN